MTAAPYAAMAHKQAWESSLMPGSPASLRVPSRVPGTSAHLERVQAISRAIELINSDPQISATAGWLVAP